MEDEENNEHHMNMRLWATPRRSQRSSSSSFPGRPNTMLASSRIKTMLANLQYGCQLQHTQQLG